MICTLESKTNVTYTITIETVLVENGLPEGRRDLVTGLTNGESVVRRTINSKMSAPRSVARCRMQISTHVMSSRMILG